MAHTLLYTLGYNAPEERILPPRISTGRTRRRFDAALKKLTDALRPWTIDFHVAQNDATVKGSGSHDKTGRHCTVRRSERQARYRPRRRLLAARRQRQADQGVPAHLLGRLHVPQCDDDEAADLERHSRRDDQGARRAWLAPVKPDPEISDEREEKTEYRHGRLRLHGPHPFQRLRQGQAISSISNISPC